MTSRLEERQESGVDIKQNKENYVTVDKLYLRLAPMSHLTTTLVLDDEVFIIFQTSLLIIFIPQRQTRKNVYEEFSQ